MAARANRYHPLLVALHWVLAILIIGNLAAGKLVLDNLANGDPQKLEVLRLHMLGGLAILGLLAIRVVTRFATARPGPSHANRGLNRLAGFSHAALYVVALAMAVTGLGTAQLAGLFPLLEGQTVTLPEDWSTIPPYAGHEAFAGVLIALIALHLAGALYHAVKRDGVFGRMWFGRREAE